MVGVRRVAFVVAAVLLLFGEPWSVLVLLPDWPVAATVSGTVVFAVAALSFPVLMVLGHGPKQNDAAARIGDVTLGTVWVLFTWSVLTHLLRLVLLVSGVDDPARPRIVAAVTLAVAAVLLVSGNRIAMRVPPVKPVDVVLPKLGPGLDGLRVAVITDTHYGPLDRTRWSERLVAELNRLQPDVVCHAGDLADGSVAKRRKQVDPLGGVQAPLGRFYITGNHEYFGEAQAWLDHMASLGWDTLHNRSTLLERDGARLLFMRHRRPHRSRLRTARPRPRPGRRPRRLRSRRPRSPARPPAETGRPSPRGKRRPADLRPHPRRPDLAVPPPGPPRPAHPVRPHPARPDPAVQQPRLRFLGPAVPGLRPERDRAADPAQRLTPSSTPSHSLRSHRLIFLS